MTSDYSNLLGVPEDSIVAILNKLLGVNGEFADLYKTDVQLITDAYWEWSNGRQPTGDIPEEVTTYVRYHLQAFGIKALPV